METQPAVHTVVSARPGHPGATIPDSVWSRGLAGEKVTVNAALYGPFPRARRSLRHPAGVDGGDHAQEPTASTGPSPFTLTIPGYYTYRETIAATRVRAAAETACGDVAETTVVTGTPKIATQVSAQETTPGRDDHRRGVVSGLGRARRRR